jgi:penicillin amidase
LANAFHAPTGTFETKMGANFRLLAVLNGSATTRSICWPGQSGQPGSAHYTDQVERHLAGEYAAIPFGWDEVEADAGVRTRLISGN